MQIFSREKPKCLKTKSYIHSFHFLLNQQQSGVSYRSVCYFKRIRVHTVSYRLGIITICHSSRKTKQKKNETEEKRRERE